MAEYTTEQLNESVFLANLPGKEIWGVEVGHLVNAVELGAERKVEEWAKKALNAGRYLAPIGGCRHDRDEDPPGPCVFCDLHELKSSYPEVGP